MIWLLVAATLSHLRYGEAYGYPPYGGYYGSNLYSPRFPQTVMASAPQTPVVEQVLDSPSFVAGPPLPGPPPPPVGVKCPPCTGPDCCEICIERSCATPEDLTILELALNPFFYVKYVEECPQTQHLDNVCYLFVPLLDLSSLFTFAQIITFQDGTAEQRQYQLECMNDGYKFTAIGSGCKFKFEIIYADILCGVYIFQRCFENPCCMIDSGPIQIMSTAIPPTKQCLCDALEYVQNLYPCKVFVELPQENQSLCTILGNTINSNHD